MPEIENIIELARAVRESTLKRLALVPVGYQDWRLTGETMSIADTVQHLVDSDYWMIEKIREPGLKAIDGVVNAVNIKSPEDYNKLLEKLDAAFNSKIEFLSGLSDNDLKIEMYDDRFEKKVSVWWIIMRGNIDHEIHHRGQLSAYLQIINSDS